MNYVCSAGSYMTNCLSSLHVPSVLAEVFIPRDRLHKMKHEEVYYKGVNIGSPDSEKNYKENLWKWSNLPFYLDRRLNPANSSDPWARAVSVSLFAVHLFAGLADSLCQLNFYSDSFEGKLQDKWLSWNQDNVPAKLFGGFILARGALAMCVNYCERKKSDAPPAHQEAGDAVHKSDLSGEKQSSSADQMLRNSNATLV